MLWILLAGIAATALLMGLTWHRASHISEQFKRLEATLARIESVERKREFERIEADNRRLMLQDSVDGGTAAIAVLHRMLSDTTFQAIDRLSGDDRIRENSLRAREIHDDVSTRVYRSIRVANRQIHSLADVIIRLNRRRQKNNGDKD